MKEWRQCPWCGRWFLGKGNQRYDSKLCGNKFRYHLEMLEIKEELECLRQLLRRPSSW